MAEGDYSFKAVINADTTSFQRNIKQAQSSVTSLSNTFGGLSKVITKALSFVGITASIGAIVKFGKESVKAADSANKSFNILNNTIRVTGATAWTTTDDIVQMSKELSDASNYTVSEIQDMQSVLLGFRNITGDTFEEASEAIMDMATVMGMDLKSATQTVGKALDDPVKGIDSLKRQGFAFTEEQKAELAQLVKNGNQLEAQKIILEELATTYGGAAKAAQSSFARAKNATIELKETLGNQLMPVIDEVLNNSTNTIKQITAEIQKIDFTRIFATIRAIADTIKPAFEGIINYFKEFAEEINSTFKGDNLKPLVSILDTSLGILKSLFNEIKSNFDRVKEMFSTMKEGLGGLADSGALQNISNVINKIIDVIWFLREQIGVVIEDARALIFDRIKAIWNNIKQLFENSNKALEENEKGFASWAEFFWSQFDQVFRIAQDLINSISALLHGNWATAWEYAKLSVLRMAKVVLDSISQIADAFPGLINKILGGINWLIEQINKFRAWLGQEPLDILGAFESVDLTESSGLGKAITDTEKKIEELTGKAADVSIKSLKGISQASKGMTQQIIGDIEDLTDAYVSNAEKQHATASNVNTAIANETESSYQMYSEWDSKLLQQRQEKLKDWQKSYHEINLLLIEEERKKALEADKTGADTEKINKYYDNEILKEKKRYNKSMLSLAKDVVKKIADVWKSLAGAISNAIKSAVNVFKNLFKFDPDEALDNLLAFEDSVLTFFVETLPKLPEFLASALQSIGVLLKNLNFSITAKKVENLMTDIIKTISSSLPEILSNGVQIAINLVTGIVNGLINNKEDVLNTIRTILQTIFELVQQLLPLLLKLFVEFLPDLIRMTVEFLPTFIQTFTDCLIIIAEALPEIIPAIIEQLPKIIAAVIEFLIGDLPRIIWAIIKGLVQGFLNVDWWQVIKDCFMGFINGFKKLFGIHSPSTFFEEMGGFMVDGLLNGLKNVGQAMLNIFKNAFEGIKSFFGKIGNWFSDTFSNLGKSIKSGWENVTDFFSNAGEKIADTASTIWDKTKDVASTVGSAVASGAKKVGSAISSGVSSVWKKVTSWFADGTNSAPRGLAIVGEAGPELVNFRGGEQVYNNTNTEKMLSNAGAKGNTFNVTFNNTKDTTAFTMMRELKQYNRNLAFNGVL